MASTSGSRKLFLQALPLLAVVRLALWVLPSAVVLRQTSRLSGRARRAPEGRRRAADAVGSAIRQASRHVPRATCLTQAITAQLLLLRYGIASELRLGVAKDAAGGLQAHAWVEAGGLVVTGGDALERYVPLPGLDPRTTAALL